jgi:polyhydroxybutyrate depolymerase
MDRTAERDAFGRGSGRRPGGTERHGTPARRHLRTATAVVVLAAAAVLVSCTPPVQPAPGTIPPGPDRGRDPTSAVAPSVGCSGGTSLAPGSSTVDIDVDGVRRTALVAVPDADGPRPVLVSLHPFLLGPEAWDAYSGLAAAGTARGYIVLTPLGSDPGPRWAVPGGLATGADDLGFVAALLDHVEDRACVDRNREYAAGFSAGAAMAQALSCTMPDRFAAVAGSGGMNLTDLCPDSPGTSVLVLHGSADPIAPPSGSEIPFAPPVGLPIATVAAVDAARAGCGPTPVVDQLTTTVRRHRFTGCTQDRRVEYLELLGAGHTWAGSPNPLLELFTGPTDTSISATATVLDLFDTVL